MKKKVIEPKGWEASLLRNTVILMFIIAVFSACTNNAQTGSDGYIISNGDSIYYKTVGQGEPLIIIHGGPVLDHTYLLDHYKILSEGYQLIFYDQRACGNSQVEIPADRMTFNAFANDIEEIRKVLGFERISILGHSWGGLLAMKYAIAYDDNIKKLILSNSMAPNAKDWDRENVAIAKRYSVEDQDQLNKLASSGLLRSKEAGQYIEQMMMLSYKAQFYDLNNLDLLHLNIPNNYALRSSIFMNLSKEMADYDLMRQLKEVKTPTLIIYGEIEPAVELYMNEFTNTFPNGQYKVIEKSGHFPFIEQRGSYFNTLTEFLDN